MGMAMSTPVRILLFAISLQLLLLVPPFDPDVILGDFTPEEYKGKTNTLKDPTIVVEDVFFPSHGEKCHAWVYSPPPPQVVGDDGESKLPPAPVVVMAPGFGTQKDFGMDRYAEKMVQAGFVVFMFDYRNFAASTGTPRNWVSPKRHIEDWHAALDYIQAKPDPVKEKVDANRILLWGTSFSGGHVLEVASSRANDAAIKGVVSQVPHLSGKEAAKKGIKTRGVAKTLRMALAVLQDKAREKLGLPPVCAKIIGSGSDMSMMLVTPEDHKRYIDKQPPQKLGGWQNQTPARILLELRFYNPIETLQKHQIKVPVLMIGSKLDALCPPKTIEEASSLLPKGSKLILREGSHFEIYEDHNYIPVSEEMVKHFQACLAE